MAVHVLVTSYFFNGAYESMAMYWMNRRSFLKLPALLPFTALGSALRSEEHYFQYERVIGTSLDLVVWTPDSRMDVFVCQTVLEEIDRLASILDTRNSISEISLLETERAGPKTSR